MDSQNPYRRIPKRAIYPLVAGLIGLMVFFVASLFNATNAPPPIVQVQPPKTSLVIIPKGASLQGNASLIPQNVTVVIGSNNTVMWRNDDNVPVSVMSGNGYVDSISGPFDTTKHQDTVPGGGYILPGKAFNFTFTEPGEYGYFVSTTPGIYRDYGIANPPNTHGIVVVALIEK
jgi:plastocyanin